MIIIYFSELILHKLEKILVVHKTSYDEQDLRTKSIVCT